MSNDLQPIHRVPLDLARPFYVYVYFDTRPGKAQQAIYVGKGHDGNSRRISRRAKCHWSRRGRNLVFQAILDQLRSAGQRPLLEIVARFQNEAEAFAYEIELIKQYGRRDICTGTLCNLTDGGDGPSGTIISESTRAKIGQSSKRYASRPEVRLRVSEMSKALHRDPEFVKRKSEAISAALNEPTRLAQRAQATAENWKDPEVRVRRLNGQRAALSKPGAAERRRAASAAWQSLDDERKCRHSEGLKRRWSDPEQRAKQSERMRAMHANPEHKRRHLDGVRRHASKRTRTKTPE